jgi:hypothetical protein
MNVLRAAEASAYLDALEGERERSAALAIHLAWLDTCSSRCGREQWAAAAPPDMLILYRAVAEAFASDQAVVPDMVPPRGARTLRAEEAFERLRAIPAPEDQYARRFVANVVRLSQDATSAQDLVFFLELFMFCVNRCHISAILNGSISLDSRRLDAPDGW